MAKEKVLVLCIDRDDDLGVKAGIKGPLIGKQAVLKGANALGLADPEDTDFNALFQSVRMYEELNKDQTAEVAVLTGHKNVGIESDRIIAKQLEKVLKAFPAKYAVLVSDGAQDEHVLPIIQSKLPIMSVNRLVVRQADELQSSYFKLKDFIETTLDSPKYARLVFGLPAIIFILYAVFGMEGWRAFLGFLGIYLLIKGFKLEQYILSGGREFRESLLEHRVSFFGYIMGAILFILATYRGYSAVLGFTGGIFELVATFVFDSIYIYFLAGAVATVCRGISHKKSRQRIIAPPIFGFGLAMIIANGAQIILNPAIGLINFLYAIAFGIILLAVALLVEFKI